MLVLALVAPAGLLAKRAAEPPARADTSAPAAATFTTTSGTHTMDDGVAIAYDLYLPAGTPPAGGWPGVLVLHGLGQRKEAYAAISTAFAPTYAVLAYDARGHGASGGNIELASPREIADLRAMRSLLAARTDVSDTQIGAWGDSYGGGQIWNALAAGVPFAAAEVVETWTDLYTALWPQGIARSGIVFGFASYTRARSPLIASLENDAVASRNMARIRPILAERSSLPRLGSVRTPVYMFQGRQDYAFDIAQATRAFTRLQGPKKLYVGAFGHSPSRFPGSDVAYVLQQGVAWFDRHLRGTPNGVDATKVEIAPEGSDGSTRAAFQGLPATSSYVLALRGTSTARGRALFSRRTAPLPRAVETWGGGTVELQVRRLSRYPRLIVTVRAGDRVVTHGGIRPRLGRNVVQLASYCVPLARGARLTVSVGPNSPRGVVAYLPLEDQGSVTVGRMTLRLSALRTRVTP